MAQSSVRIARAAPLRSDLWRNGSWTVSAVLGLYMSGMASALRDAKEGGTSAHLTGVPLEPLFNPLPLQTNRAATAIRCECWLHRSGGALSGGLR